ncbi:insulinase family protein [Bacillus cereus]|nr:insulinase family protein [Bacillus cereus]
MTTLCCNINSINFLTPDKYSTNNFIIKINTLKYSPLVTYFHYHLLTNVLKDNICEAKVESDIQISPLYSEMIFSIQWINNNSIVSKQIVNKCIQIIQADYLKTYQNKMGIDYITFLKNKSKDNLDSLSIIPNQLINNFYYSKSEDTLNIKEEFNIHDFLDDSQINVYTNLKKQFLENYHLKIQSIEFNELLRNKTGTSTLPKIIDKNNFRNDDLSGIYGLLSAPIRIGSYENIILQVINGLMGRFPYSRLTRRIRNEENLAYYVKSKIYNYHGIIVITIYSNFFDKVTELLIDEIDNLKSIEEEELALVKKSLIHHFSKAQDYPISEVNLKDQYFITNPNYYYNYKQIIESISIEDVKSMLNHLNLDAIYRIKE